MSSNFSSVQYSSILSNNPENLISIKSTSQHSSHFSIPTRWKPNTLLPPPLQVQTFEQIPIKIARLTSFEERIAEQFVENVVQILLQFCSSAERALEKDDEKQEEELKERSEESRKKIVVEEMCNVLQNEDAALLLEKIGKCELGKHKDFILLLVFLILLEHSKTKMKKNSERKLRLKIEENVGKLPQTVGMMLKNYELSQKGGFSQMVKRVGRILMSYLEGLYYDRIDECGKLEESNIAKVPRKLRKIL